jgi:hypothetical protein
MPQITLTLSDTPDGGVSIHSSFKPAAGLPCSAAQSLALDVIARTHKQWGVPAVSAHKVIHITPRQPVAGESAA